MDPYNAGARNDSCSAVYLLFRLTAIRAATS